MNPRKLFITSLFLTAMLPNSYSQASVPDALSVNEGLTDPLGFYDSMPRFSWKLGDADIRQSAYQIVVADASQAKLWDSGPVESDQSTFVPYGGSALGSRDAVTWRVRYWNDEGEVSAFSEWAQIEMGLLTNAEWNGQWIHQQLEDADPDGNFGAVLYVRKQFTVAGDPTKARLYVTAKGIYEIEINGQRVAHDAFVPGFTDYHKRIETLTYDVTDLAQAGDNVISAKVANGWYAGRLMWKDARNLWGKCPELLVQLELTTDDGNAVQIVSDASWKGTTTGPIVMADIYDGEDYDARLELTGWSEVGFDDSAMTPVAINPVLEKPRLAPKRFTTPHVEQVLQAQAMELRPDGSVIFDLGQNIVGWPQIQLPVNAGVPIQINVAEMLNSDGSLYTENYRSARSSAQYIPAQNGLITWKPTFSFFGFRYVALSGFDAEATPSLDWVRGLVLHTKFDQTGAFNSSHTKLNQLQQNIQWGQRGNFLDIPTDCPQRDERLGWTGDAQVFAATSLYNFDTHAFWSAWLESMREDQKPDGSISNFIPSPPGTKGTSPGWGDSAFVIPWELYVRTGDVEVLRENYEMMCGRVGWYAKASKDGLVEFKGFGDWLQPKASKQRGDTSMQLISTAYYGYGAALCAKAARVLGKESEALAYDAMAAKVRDAVGEHFLNADGKLTTEVETQTGYLLLLAFDLVLPEMRSSVAAQLAAKVASENGRLNTGFLGTPLINRVLDQTGYQEQALAVLFTDDYPSWFYSIDQGATTMWERWNSYSHADGFGPVGMNSFNHYAYGAVGQWMYERLAGLAPDSAQPGYKHIIVSPLVASQLQWAAAELQTPYGLAKSGWKKDGDRLQMEVVVPPNSGATVIFPSANGSGISVNGEALSDSDWAKSTTLNTQQQVTLEIPAGSYQFELKDWQ